MTRSRGSLAVLALTAALWSGSLIAGASSEARQLAARAPDIGFEPTSLAVAEDMLRLAHVDAGDVVFDLGSGDGRLVNLAAQKYGARGVGIEIEPYLVKRAREAAAQAKVDDKVTFIEGDLFDADISRATVVLMYLWPGVNARLKWKLRMELKPGTRIVSSTFGIGDWQPDQVIRASDGRELSLWTVPRAPRRIPDVECVPTPQPVVEEMLRLAGLKADDLVYDLGSGDGRIVILGAQQYGVRGVGIEIDPVFVEVARATAREIGKEDALSFIEGDLFEADVSKATLVTIALSPDINRRLAPKLLKELRPGTRIVSYAAGFESWIPSKVVKSWDGKLLYLYEVAAGQRVGPARP
jgi:predicted RNA methylase